MYAVEALTAEASKGNRDCRFFLFIGAAALGGPEVRREDSRPVRFCVAVDNGVGAA